MGVARGAVNTLNARARCDLRTNALGAGITVTSLQELASDKGSVHDDLMNRFLGLVALETSLDVARRHTTACLSRACLRLGSLLWGEY
jgi:hypothetical protein